MGNSFKTRLLILLGMGILVTSGCSKSNIHNEDAVESSLATETEAT